MAGPEVTEVPTPTTEIPIPAALAEYAVMAPEGYGKYTVPDEPPAELPAGHDPFAHLPGVRERYLARLIDALPEGASMSVKELAHLQPLYGQAAIRTAMEVLRHYGHLRGYRAPMPGNRRLTWVQLTYFARHARPEATNQDWWATAFRTRETQLAAAFYASNPHADRSKPFPLPRPRPWETAAANSTTAAASSATTTGAAGTEAGNHRAPATSTTPTATGQRASATPAAAAASADHTASLATTARRNAHPVDDRAPTTPAARRTAYAVLSALGRTDARVHLTEHECRTLTNLAAQWIDRGTTPHQLTTALTSELPPHIANPGGFTRTRLRDNMPPPRTPATDTAVHAADNHAAPPPRTAPAAPVPAPRPAPTPQPQPQPQHQAPPEAEQYQPEARPQPQPEQHPQPQPQAQHQAPAPAQAPAQHTRSQAQPQAPIPLPQPRSQPDARTRPDLPTQPDTLTCGICRTPLPRALAHGPFNLCHPCYTANQASNTSKARTSSGNDKNHNNGPETRRNTDRTRRAPTPEPPTTPEPPAIPARPADPAELTAMLGELLKRVDDV